MDCKQPQGYIRKCITEADANVFFLRDYETPESLIKNLQEILVLPKDHPEILVDNKDSDI
jgi:hypothetical protein